MLLRGFFLFDGQQGETIRVLVITAPRAVHEQHQGADDEHEAHENLQDQDFHSGLLGEREKVVASTTVIELTGMTTAQTSGERSPA